MALFAIQQARMLGNQGATIDELVALADIEEAKDSPSVLVATDFPPHNHDPNLMKLDRSKHLPS